MTQTELEYEVARWMKINPKPVTEDLLSYVTRAVEALTEEAYQRGYDDGRGDMVAGT